MSSLAMDRGKRSSKKRSDRFEACYITAFWWGLGLIVLAMVYGVAKALASL